MYIITPICHYCSNPFKKDEGVGEAKNFCSEECLKEVVVNGKKGRKPFQKPTSKTTK